MQNSLTVQQAQFQALAIRAGVQLPAPPAKGIYLGTVSPLLGEPGRSESSNRALERIYAVRDELLNLVKAPGGSPQEMAERQRSLIVMPYESYLEAVKSANQLPRSFQEGKYIPPHLNTPECAHFVLRLYRNAVHKPDFESYLGYVCDVNAVYAKALDNVPAPVLDEATRQQHTYIAAGAGSGKTELMKAFIQHDVNEGHAIIILDPQGNLARAVARWPDFAGAAKSRLMYFDPRLGNDRNSVPGFNPLNTEGMDEEERSIVAEQLVDALAQVVGKEDWSTRTETVARNCLNVLVHQKHVTLFDLHEALFRDDRGKKIPAKAARMQEMGLNHHNRAVRSFFENSFFSQEYVAAKGSLVGKLDSILSNDIFSDVISVRPKISLETLINERKVTVFNLGAWGNERGAGAFGRLLIAQIAALGMRRSMKGGEKVPVHVYVDEADWFVSPAVLNILSKLRQHGVHLTLVQQTAGFNFQGQDKQQLFTNTAIKFTSGGQREMVASMNAPADATQGLEQGQFVGRWGRAGELFRLDVRRDLAGDGNAMTEEEWSELVDYQLHRYYTRRNEVFAPSAPLLVEAAEETATSAPAQNDVTGWLE
jgi:hypothetical protein